MAQLDVSLTGTVKESTKDVQALASFAVTMKETVIPEYDGAKKITVPAGKTVSINVDHLPHLRLVGIENALVGGIPGPVLRLRLRHSNSESTDLVIGRFFYADVRNVETIKLVNESSTSDADVRLFLVGVNG